jgi:two-component system OmpR family response regulator
MALILVVDDEASLAEMICDALNIAGHTAVAAHDGIAALAIVREQHPNLIITDVNMPKVDGFELLERLRSSGNETPVIVLTARTDKQDLAKGFRSGADDFMVKPFVLQELILRVSAVLRRTSGSSTESNILECGPIRVIDDERLVELNGEPVELTRTEYRLLLELIQHKGKVVRKRDLLENIWGMGFATGATVVDTYISYLRRKLHTPDWVGIKTIRGEGFQITDAPNN